MESFRWECSTKVRFGQGCVKEYLGELVRESAPAGSNIMIGLGGGSAKKNGAYDDVMDVLVSMGYSKDAQSECTGGRIVEFSGIMPNPTYAKVQEGAKLARENAVDLILAAGGGSVIDSSKAIANGAADMTLDEIKTKDAKQQLLKCSCAGGKALAAAQVTGIHVSSILQMADLEDGTNTITFKSQDGYGIPLPLQYVMDKEAMLVYKIGETELDAENGGYLQVWMPDTVAKYFTRQVTEIELGRSEKLPEVQQPANTYQVSILNRFDNSFKVGDQISFEGYADDFNTAISAVEFSLDGGATWTSYKTANASSRLWVYWNFDYVTEAPGTYRLDVRARAADGTVSPLASSVVFTVEEAVNTSAAI